MKKRGIKNPRDNKTNTAFDDLFATRGTLAKEFEDALSPISKVKEELYKLGGAVSVAEMPVGVKERMGKLSAFVRFVFSIAQGFA